MQLYENFTESYVHHPYNLIDIFFYYQILFNTLFAVDQKNSPWTNLHRLIQKIMKRKCLTSKYKYSVFNAT